MPITAEELFNNFYFACLQVAGTPYKYCRSDIELFCVGTTITIRVWTVEGVPQPDDAYLMANCDMATIATIAIACQTN
jgi:hypothetical protein